MSTADAVTSTAPTDRGAPTEPPWAHWARRFGWQTLAAMNTVLIVFSAVRGVARGYEPIGDNALIELRGRDVLTGDHPLLGTWSSASISAGLDVNHPGPLIFDVVALPVRVLGESAGIAIAVAIVHIVAVWLVGIVINRAGGATAAIVAQATTAGILWMLGSELLYDPWQPNFLVIPFWLMLCTTWAIAAGFIRYLPLACGAGSLAMQTHLSYLFIVPLLLATGVFLAARLLGPDRRGELRRPILLSVGVIVVLWAQPFWEQISGAGQGNISRIVEAGTGGGDGDRVDSTKLGLSMVVRILGAVLALPPWWGRSGYDDSIPASTWVETPDGPEIVAPGLPSVAAAGFALCVLTGLLGLCWWATVRRGNRFVLAGLQIAAVALLVAVVTVAITPVDVLGLSPHKVRWLWVIGALLTTVLILGVLSWIDARRRRIGVMIVFAVGVIAGIATVPTHRNLSGPVYFAATYGSIRDLRDQLDDYLAENDVDEVLFDADGIGFAEPYTAPVMAELLVHGVDLVVDDDALARQLGPARHGDPDDVADRPVIYVRVGEEAAATPEGAERIAFHAGDLTNFTLDSVTDRAVGVFVRWPSDGDER